jgi:DNA modification methylase
MGAPLLDRQQVVFGDCREVLKSYPDNHFDSLVTDPPSGIKFLGLDWDTFKPSESEENIEGRAELLAFQNFLVAVFREVFRVLKPGGFGLVWALPRTSHHTKMALERSGFEIRDTLYHAFGQGYKKGTDVSKEFEESGDHENAEKWVGYHTGMKPAIEEWVLVRKPIDGTIIENILEYGTGAINIDDSRVFTDWDEPDRPDTWKKSGHSAKPEASKVAAPPGTGINCHPLGRWPADFILSHSPECKRVGTKVIKGDPRGDCKGTRPGGFYSPGSDSGDGKPNAYVYGDQKIPVYECIQGCPVGILDKQSGLLKSGMSNVRKQPSPYWEGGAVTGKQEVAYGDSGGASRFFKVFEPEYESNFIYQAKPSPTEKNADLDEGLVNEHKTVKSLKLMTYLVRLVTPADGKTLDPFAGSGTTLVAAAELGFGFLGIEKDEKTWPVLKSRVTNVLQRIEDVRDMEEAANLVFELESE